jgi:hypothetical protein
MERVLIDEHFLGSPVLGGTRINPIAMQLKTNFLITLGHKERFQRSRYGKIDPAIHLLKRPFKLYRAFRPDLTLDGGGDNFIKVNFILKCGNYLAFLLLPWAQEVCKPPQPPGPEPELETPS